MRFLSSCGAMLAVVLLAASAQAFEVSSSSFTQGQPLPAPYSFNSFGCTGQNLSPALAWKNAPKGTKSFAITAYDPDAPTGSGWWHWVVVNIPASVDHVAEGEKIAGALETRTDFGSAGYGGPCPPEGHGVHHYHFTIHALDVEKLDLTADASGALVGYNLHAHSLGTASIMGTFERKK